MCIIPLLPLLVTLQRWQKSAVTVKTQLITWHELVFHGILLVLLLAVLFPATFVKGEIILPGRVLLDMAPWQEYAPADFVPSRNWLPSEALSLFNLWFKLTREAFGDGEWPFWNHLQFTGMPLLANYQSAIFFPLRLLHVVFEMYLATTIYYLARLWLCGFNAYLCGRGIRLDRAPAAFFSIGMMMSGYNVTWQYWPEPGVIAFLPLVFLGAEYILDARYRKGFFILLAGAVPMMLAGHPETALTGSVGVGLYFVLRLAWQRPHGQAFWKPVAAAGAAWCIVLAVCAVQILPFLQYVEHSSAVIEQLSRATAAEKAIPISGLALLFVPRFFGLTADDNFWMTPVENSNYVTLIYPGIVVWACIALLTARGVWPRKRRTQVVCLAISCALSLLLVFQIGWLEPLHNLPGFRFVWQLWYCVFAMFGLPLLGALGLQHWFGERRRIADIWRPLAVIPAIMLIPAALYLFNRRVLAMQPELQGYVHHQLLYAAFFLVAAVVATMAWVVLRKRAVIVLFAALLAGDLGLAARDMLPTAPRSCFYFETPLTDYLSGLPKPARFSMASAGIKPGLLQMYDLEQLWTCDGIYPGRMMRFMEECHPEAWETIEPLCSVNYYLFREESYDLAAADPYFRHVTTLNGIHVMQNTRAYPRAFLVPRLEVIEDVDALFERMRSLGYDPGAVALTEVRPQSPLPDTPATELGTANVTRRSRNELVVKVDALERCLLVVSEAYYPGWHSYVDGQRTELLPVYHVFRGVIVPQGGHTVTFRMEPGVFYVGLTISSLALIFGLLMAVGALLSSVRPRAGRAPE